MKVSLLDVNVLIALMWPAHEGHTRVQEWFGKYSQDGWATCPFTQTAFIRIVSNPAFSPDAVTPFEATKLLSANLRHAAHYFWPDDIPFGVATESFSKKLTGHNQVTDAYLLGLTIHKKGQFVTMDEGIKTILNSKSTEAARIVLI